MYVGELLSAWGGRSARASLMRQVFTERDIPAGGEMRVAQGSIFTPSARDLARERDVAIIELAPHEMPGLAAPEKTVAIGADHGGFRLKQALLPVLAELGFAPRDVGVFEESPADYPDIALRVADLVAGGSAARGVIIDGAGIGSAIAANKVRGVRAALCYDVATARNGGVDALAVTWGFHSRERLSGARWVCDQVDEMVARMLEVGCARAASSTT